MSHKPSCILTGQLLHWFIPKAAGMAPLPPLSIPGGHNRVVFSISILSSQKLQPSRPQSNTQPSQNGDSCGSESSGDGAKAGGGDDDNSQSTQDAGAPRQSDGDVSEGEAGVSETEPEALKGDEALEIHAQETAERVQSGASSSSSTRPQTDSLGTVLRFATVSLDRSLLIWALRVPKGNPIWKYAKVRHVLRAVAEVSLPNAAEAHAHRQVAWTLRGLGGAGAALSATPASWALACGDKTIRSWKGESAETVKLIWRDSKTASNVLALAWFPPSAAPLLAYGCDTGEVGVCDVRKETYHPLSIQHKAPIRSARMHRSLSHVSTEVMILKGA